MAKYTISIMDKIIEGATAGEDISDPVDLTEISKRVLFPTSINVLSAEYRDRFALSFATHYIMDEIGVETWPLFKILLNGRLRDNAEMINWIFENLDKEVFSNYKVHKTTNTHESKIILNEFVNGSMSGDNKSIGEDIRSSRDNVTDSGQDNTSSSDRNSSTGTDRSSNTHSQTGSTIEKISGEDVFDNVGHNQEASTDTTANTHTQKGTKTDTDSYEGQTTYKPDCKEKTIDGANKNSKKGTATKTTEVNNDETETPNKTVTTKHNTTDTKTISGTIEHLKSGSETVAETGEDTEALTNPQIDKEKVTTIYDHTTTTDPTGKTVEHAKVNGFADTPGNQVGIPAGASTNAKVGSILTSGYLTTLTGDDETTKESNEAVTVNERTNGSGDSVSTETTHGAYSKTFGKGTTTKTTYDGMKTVDSYGTTSPYQEKTTKQGDDTVTESGKSLKNLKGNTKEINSFSPDYSEDESYNKHEIENVVTEGLEKKNDTHTTTHTVSPDYEEKDVHSGGISKTGEKAETNTTKYGKVVTNEVSPDYGSNDKSTTDHSTEESGSGETTTTYGKKSDRVGEETTRSQNSTNRTQTTKDIKNGDTTQNSKDTVMEEWYDWNYEMLISAETFLNKIWPIFDDLFLGIY